MDIVADSITRAINYAEVAKRSYVKIVDKEYMDISVIIPVHGRTQFHEVLTRHFYAAMQQVKDRKISLTFVEHAVKPEHNNLIWKWVNYIYIPQGEDRFNKCLCMNMGALYAPKANYYLFHDCDTLPGKFFFKKLFENLVGHDAVQCFADRRLLHCDEILTQKLIDASTDAYKEIGKFNITKSHENIKVAQPGAKGGSMCVSREIFFKIGGFMPHLFSEYSVEDALFFDMLSLYGKLGFCDNPRIEMLHLHHPPSFNRTTKHHDHEAIEIYYNLNRQDKDRFVEANSNNLKKYYTEAIVIFTTNFPKFPPPFKPSVMPEINLDTPAVKPKVRIYDNQFKHSQGGSFGTGDLNIKPNCFDWSWEPVQDAKVAIFTENCFSLAASAPEPIKIAMILEPPSVSPEPYEYIKTQFTNFSYVLTHQESLLKIDPRFRQYFFGGCWIKPEDRKIHPKLKNVSIIASQKRATKGQMLRHSAIDVVGRFIEGIYGRGYTPVENKIEALRNFRYSIVIENEESSTWITEKLIDCFMTGTIPIYWGSPTVMKYFNRQGFFIWNNLDELRVILEFICREPEFVYLSRMNFIKENFEKAKQYIIPEDAIYKTFLKKLI